jgi:hypothetical protein
LEYFVTKNMKRDGFTPMLIFLLLNILYTRRRISMSELDWRDRPAMSPFGGFLIQSRYGRNGNFEVVIPWHRGGLAHFSRDNDRGFQWHGPSIFGDTLTRYIGATIIESDYRFISGYRFGNLEVLATRRDDTVDHCWRENGANFLWHGPFKTFDDAFGAPSMAYSGAVKLNGGHGGSSFYVVYPDRSKGFSYWRRHNSELGDFPLGKSRWYGYRVSTRYRIFRNYDLILQSLNHLELNFLVN